MGRRQRKRNLDQPGGHNPGASEFKVVVAAGASEDLNVQPEVELIKAAMLYGDEVTVMSPLLTMLMRAEGLRTLEPLQIVELMRRVGPYLLAEQDAANFESGLAQVEDVLQQERRGKSAASRVLQNELLRRLQPARQLLAEAVDGLAERSGATALEHARAAGLLEVQSVDPGDAVDLIASCVISAKLVEQGDQPTSEHTTRLTNTFLDRLGQHLESGRDYLIFDRPTASLVDAALKEGYFSPTTGASRRTAQAMSASGLLARLPTFPDASLDEVIDIRSDLRAPLGRFRGAMVTAANGFDANAWDDRFEDEIHDFWVETVGPALQAIHDEVRSSKSLTAIAAGVVGGARATMPGLALIGAGLAGHAQALTLAGEVATAAAPLLDAVRNHQRQTGELRMKPFYFLYGVDTALA